MSIEDLMIGFLIVINLVLVGLFAAQIITSRKDSAEYRRIFRDINK